MKEKTGQALLNRLHKKGQRVEKEEPKMDIEYLDEQQKGYSISAARLKSYGLENTQ